MLRSCFSSQYIEHPAACSGAITLAPNSARSMPSGRPSVIKAHRHRRAKGRVFLKIAGIERWRKVALFQLRHANEQIYSFPHYVWRPLLDESFQSDGQSPAHQCLLHPDTACGHSPPGSWRVNRLPTSRRTVSPAPGQPSGRVEPERAIGADSPGDRAAVRPQRHKAPRPTR